MNVGALRNIVFPVFIAIVFIGCSKSVFQYSDENGESTFVLYKKNYKYSEKTKARSFKTHGTYEATDSTLTFLQWGRENIPFPYILKSINVNDRNKVPDGFTISVIDHPSSDPILFATIAYMDANDRILDGVETNLDGEAFIAFDTPYDYLSIEYVGYGKVNIDNSEFRDKDFTIELEQMKPGGRMSSGCLLTFLDIFLTYEVDKKENFTSFSRNGVVYRKLNEE